MKSSSFTNPCFSVDFADSFFFFLEQLYLFQTMDLGLTYLMKYLFCYICSVSFIRDTIHGKVEIPFPAFHIYNILNNHFKYLNILSYLFSLIFSKSTLYFFPEPYVFYFKNHFCNITFSYLRQYSSCLNYCFRKAIFIIFNGKVFLYFYLHYGKILWNANLPFAMSLSFIYLFFAVYLHHVPHKLLLHEYSYFC